MRALTGALIGFAFLLLALPVYALNTFTYTAYDFGPDVNGNIWNIWASNGSNVWDWHADYVNGFLRYTFKVHNYPNFYCGGSCRIHVIWNKDPTTGFTSADTSFRGDLFPQNNQNNHIYNVDIQWNVNGYHVSVYDETAGQPYSEADYVVPVTSTTYDAFTFQMFWGFYYGPTFFYFEETPTDHANNFLFQLHYQERTGTSGGGYDVRTTARPVIQQATGPSSVLFIPGIEASRLYQPDASSLSGEKRIWEPSLVGHDNSRLAMTPSGTSVELNVYTKDAIDSALGVDIYESFFEAMQQLASTTGSEFEVFPYDWRYAADAVASNPTRLVATTTILVDEIKNLAGRSNSGKVTIVAHSNGGLVAKAAMLALGPTATQYVDKLIFVAVPQVGTPQALAGLLHGYKEGIPLSWAPLLISDSEIRTLGQNMPSAYGLLPSAEYFSSIFTPVITISTSTLSDWASQYGEAINSSTTLDAFLTDTAGLRTKPSASDLDDPEILLPNLLGGADTLHQSLDAWTPPAGVKLVQIAGWGIPKTVSSISYSENTEGVEPSPEFTIDGDGTVVTPSALWTSSTVGAEDYWIDLNTYNNQHFFSTLGGLLPINHAGILSIPELTDYISDVLISDVKPLSDYKYLYTEAPSSTQTRLIYVLHSPLSLDVYDNQSHHTGISTTTGEIEEQVPGTYYAEFGETKYIFTNTDIPVRLILGGYADGTFTLDANQYLGDTLTASKTWQYVPTTADTAVLLDAPSDITSLSTLRVDQNSDGTTDYNLSTSYRFDGFLQPIN